MEKIQKTAKMIDLFLRILFWFVIAIGVLNFGMRTASIILLLVKPEMAAADAGFVLGAFSFHIHPAAAPDANFGLWINALQLASLAVIIPAACYGIHVFRAILRPMRIQQPFDSAVSGQLRKLSGLGLLLFVLTNLFSWLQIVILVSGFDLSNLLTGSSITSVSADFDIDFTFALVAGILLLLSYVFRHGAQLQQLSDETL